ncbi:MAG: tetratricopeptide repeat protein [Bryobacterales bacterium]|nr:tetratricopeptide repeat protein [Bryobacterales bacterium]
MRLLLLILLAALRLPADGGAAAGYVDTATCRSCHQRIYDEYQKTTMGRAFYLPDPEKMVEDWSEHNSYYHEPSQRHYEMTRRGDKFYVRRYQLDAQGRRIHQLEKQVTHVMGSGARARSYIHQTSNGRMVELPISWYAQENSWGMAPGYDKPDHAGFTRIITNRCMFCHNGYPFSAMKADRPGWDHDPSFRGAIPMGIDCQRCHGPGEEHIREANNPTSIERVRKTITNPARLGAERQLDICMQCHLETPFRTPKSVLRFGRSFYSYRPGEPLSDYIVHFDYEEGTGHEDDFLIVSAAYRLRKSACFQQSSKMTCTTCHDPHESLPPAERAAHYRQVCLGCHEVESHFQSADCTECHMPARRTKDVVRVVMTDHFIQRSKPDRDLLAPLEEEADESTDWEAGSIVYFPGGSELSGPLRDIYRAISHGKETANAQAASELSSALSEAAVDKPDPFFDLAEMQSKLGRLADAEKNYLRAIEIDPEYIQAYNNLGNLLADMGRREEAIEILKKTIELDGGYSADPYNNLGLVYISLQRQRGAEQAFRDAAEANPFFADARLNLGTVLFEQGEYETAVLEFQEALAIDPGVLRARNNLAFAMLALGRTSEAIPYLQEVVRDGDESLREAANKALELIHSSVR